MQFDAFQEHEKARFLKRKPVRQCEFPTPGNSSRAKMLVNSSRAARHFSLGLFGESEKAYETTQSVLDF